MGEQKWQANVICKINKVAIWDTPISTSVLATTFRHFDRLELKLNEY